jgi:IclR family transcriptional regulator, KDG regulon repressor
VYYLLSQSTAPIWQEETALPTIRTKDSYSIQSVDNALDVLEALCEEEDEVRISHLSEKLGMNKTSVFRLMATFENRGYVEKEPGSGRYRLGVSAYEMGQKFLSRMGLLRKARPVMEQLGRKCDEAVYLAIRRHDEVLFLDMVDTGHRVKVISLLGKRYPLASISAGRIILAHLPQEEQGMSNKYNGKTTRIPFDELQDLRVNGFCLDSGIPGEGIVSISVPLLRAGAAVSGALCMVVPEYRMAPENLQRELLPHLKEAGEIISSKLGYLGHYL